jgi:hypothetical protein
MKRIFPLLLGAACLGATCLAQENAARAAAEREAAEERYKLLNSAVDALTTGQADLQRRISALADEVRAVRAQDNKVDTSKFVTREEYSRLAKAIEEIEQKRESDKKLIREEFEQLKKDITKILNSSAPAAPPKKPKTQPATEKNTDKSSEKLTDKSDKTSDATPPTQEGVWYVIQPGNTLNAIANAHNEEFKKNGKKTSIKLIQDANAGLKPTTLKVGQKI